MTHEHQSSFVFDSMPPIRICDDCGEQYLTEQDKANYHQYTGREYGA